MKTTMNGISYALHRGAVVAAAVAACLAGPGRAVAVDFDQGVALAPLLLELRRDANAAPGTGPAAEVREAASESSEDEDARRFYGLAAAAYGALEEGEAEKAVALARELLTMADRFKDDWNYGNAIHHGNVVLGRAALAAGDVPRAEWHLFAAGRTPGSPQLDSFGPNLSLGKALLERGQQVSVISFLDQCERFWDMGHDELAAWRREIRAGRVPDFGSNLEYGTSFAPRRAERDGPISVAPRACYENSRLAGMGPADALGFCSAVGSPESATFCVEEAVRRGLDAPAAVALCHEVR